MTRAFRRAPRGPRRAFSSAVGWLGGAVHGQDPPEVNFASRSNYAVHEGSDSLEVPPAVQSGGQSRSSGCRLKCGTDPTRSVRDQNSTVTRNYAPANAASGQPIS